MTQQATEATRNGRAWWKIEETLKWDEQQNTLDSSGGDDDDDDDDDGDGG